MPATVERLKEKIADLQRGLAEVSAALDELTQQQAERDYGAVPLNEPDPLGGASFADSREVLRLFDRASAEMGMELPKDAPTPEDVQELMLREGVQPQDNILSRGIIDAREE